VAVFIPKHLAFPILQSFLFHLFDPITCLGSANVNCHFFSIGCMLDYTPCCVLGYASSLQVPLAALAPGYPLEHWLPLGSHTTSGSSSSSSGSSRDVHPWLLQVRCTMALAQMALEAPL